MHFEPTRKNNEIESGSSLTLAGDLSWLLPF